eukprot:GHVL01018793.1.p1 GENE.GHVL01018793.1~~GHVL01018793.1.p1  ORF type:complete len:649 (+),score=68.12 GHVL01018793.1:1158-3104(+)
MLAIAAALAIFVWPKFFDIVLNSELKIAGRHLYRPNDPKSSFQPKDKLLLVFMFIFLIAWSTASSYLGSHLLGSFAAGMSFVGVHRAHIVWSRQTKRVVEWLLRLFFAAAVAFAIPVATLLTVEGFWMGIVVAIVPAILAKLVAGLHMGSSRWVVGWAMVGRAEFAYLIAQSAESEGLISEKAFAMTIWALLISTLIAPFAFKYSLKQQQKRTKTDVSQRISKAPWNNAADIVDSSFRIQIAASHRSGLVFELCGIMHELGLDVRQVKMTSDNIVVISTFHVKPRGNAMVDEEKLGEIQHQLYESLDSHDAKVVFLPGEYRTAHYPLIKVTVIASWHPDLLERLAITVHEKSLLVRQASVEVHQDLVVVILLCQESLVSSYEIGGDSLEANFPNITDVTISNIRRALQAMLADLKNPGDAQVYGILPERLGPTGEIRHEPLSLKQTDKPQIIRKVAMVLEQNELPSLRLVPTVLEVARNLNLNLLAARLEKRGFVFYFDAESENENLNDVSDPLGDADVNTEIGTIRKNGDELNRYTRDFSNAISSLGYKSKLTYESLESERRVNRFLSFSMGSEQRTDQNVQSDFLLSGFGAALMGVDIDTVNRKNCRESLTEWKGGISQRNQQLTPTSKKIDIASPQLQSSSGVEI